MPRMKALEEEENEGEMGQLLREVRRRNATRRKRKTKTYWFLLSLGGTQGVAVHLCSMLDPITVCPSTGMGVTTASEGTRKTKKRESAFASSLSLLPLPFWFSCLPSEDTRTRTYPKLVPKDASLPVLQSTRTQPSSTSECRTDSPRHGKHSLGRSGSRRRS